ncbi:MAG: ATP-binding protein, partial [Anaerolineales bacterium]|nr:ATP-binding protein [Anaerolineales bacterium]
MAERLSIESGVETYTGSTVSNWERGLNKIRRDDRHVLVGLIKVLHEGGGIKTPEAANLLLLAGNYRPLDDGELRDVNPVWKQFQPILSAADVPSAVEQEALLPTPSYSRLFGVDDLIQDVVEQLISSHSRMIVLTGISGVGKTAVADAVARHAIRHNLFAQVVWISADVDNSEVLPETDAHIVINKLCQRLLTEDDHKSHLSQQLMRLRYKLQAQPHLIVIDDLGHFAEMLPLLDRLLGIIGTG